MADQSQKTAADTALMEALRKSSIPGVDDETMREAVIEHAKYLGMDPVEDVQFLWIAAEALTAELPPGWTQGMTDNGDVYYFNEDENSSTWEHPRDDEFRAKYRAYKLKSGQTITNSSPSGDTEHNKSPASSNHQPNGQAESTKSSEHLQPTTTHDESTTVCESSSASPTTKDSVSQKVISPSGTATISNHALGSRESGLAYDYEGIDLSSSFATDESFSPSPRKPLTRSALGTESHTTSPSTHQTAVATKTNDFTSSNYEKDTKMSQQIQSYESPVRKRDGSHTQTKPIQSPELLDMIGSPSGGDFDDFDASEDFDAQSLSTSLKNVEESSHAATSGSVTTLQHSIHPSTSESSTEHNISQTSTSVQKVSDTTHTQQTNSTAEMRTMSEEPSQINRRPLRALDTSDREELSTNMLSSTRTKFSNRLSDSHSSQISGTPDIQAGLNAWRRRAEKAEAAVDMLEQENKSLQKRFEEQKSKQNAENGALEAKEAAAKHQADMAEAELQKLREQIKILSDKTQNSENTLTASFKEREAQNQKTIETLRARINETEEMLAIRAKELQNVQKFKDSIEEKYQQLNSTLLDRDAQIDTLQQGRLNLENELKTLQDRNTKLVNDFNGSQIKLKSLETEISKSNTQNNESLSTLKSENEKKQQELESLKISNHSLEESVRESTATIQELKSKLMQQEKQTNQEKMDADNRYNRLHLQLETIQKEHKEQIESKENGYLNLQQWFEALQIQERNTQNSLQKSRDEIQAIQQKYDQDSAQYKHELDTLKHQFEQEKNKARIEYSELEQLHASAESKLQAELAMLHQTHAKELAQAKDQVHTQVKADAQRTIDQVQIALDKAKTDLLSQEEEANKKEAEMKAMLVDIEVQLNQYKEDYSFLENKCNSARSELDTLQQTHSQSQTQVIELQQQIQELEKNLNDSKHSNDTLQEKLSNVMAQNNTSMESELNKIRFQLDEANKTILDREEEIITITQEYKDAVKQVRLHAKQAVMTATKDVAIHTQAQVRQELQNEILHWQKVAQEAEYRMELDRRELETAKTKFEHQIIEIRGRTKSLRDEYRSECDRLNAMNTQLVALLQAHNIHGTSFIQSQDLPQNMPQNLSLSQTQQKIPLSTQTMNMPLSDAMIDHVDTKAMTKRMMNPSTQSNIAIQPSTHVTTKSPTTQQTYLASGLHHKQDSDHMTQMQQGTSVLLNRLEQQLADLHVLGRSAVAMATVPQPVSPPNHVLGFTDMSNKLSPYQQSRTIQKRTVNDNDNQPYYDTQDPNLLKVIRRLDMTRDTSNILTSLKLNHYNGKENESTVLGDIQDSKTPDRFTGKQSFWRNHSNKQVHDMHLKSSQEKLNLSSISYRTKRNPETEISWYKPGYWEDKYGADSIRRNMLAATNSAIQSKD